MGQGRVDPAPPVPINSDPKERKRGGKRRRRKGQKTGRETEREKPTVLREKEPKQ
jgi:hypothetical protein